MYANSAYFGSLRIIVEMNTKHLILKPACVYPKDTSFSAANILYYEKKPCYMAWDTLIVILKYLYYQDKNVSFNCLVRYNIHRQLLIEL
jgi:hypothetical protein